MVTLKGTAMLKANTVNECTVAASQTRLLTKNKVGITEFVSPHIFIKDRLVIFWLTTPLQNEES